MARLSTRRDPWYPRRDNTGVTCWERTERVRWTSCASAQQHERNEKIVYLGHPGFMPRRCSMEGKTLRRTTVALLLAGAVASTPLSSLADDRSNSGGSQAVRFTAPAGDLPTTREIFISGLRAAILPNGRFITPAGVEVNVDAPKPFGIALSPDGQTLATINSGASRFSVSLIRNADTALPAVQRVNVDATFMGVVFSSDGVRFYASGGENGNIWVGDVATGTIVGSVNLNGSAHPLDRPLNPNAAPSRRFKGAFPGNLALTRNGRYLY